MKSKRQVKVGNVFIGGGSPITIQSMTNTKTDDIDATVSQIEQLKKAGCDIVRCAIPDRESARAIYEIKKKIEMPLVADIHFDYRLALASIENGADKIRINPGNIGDESAVKEIATAAKAKDIPIRIGVNGGSLQKDIIARYGGRTPDALVESAIRNVRLLEKFDFHDIVLSVKTSDVRVNFEAHKLLREKTDCPLHIGITESGTGDRAIIKSAIGIGSLLLSGIGDTIRVSLTGDPVREVECGIDILSSIGLRKGIFNMISCPTCGRTEVDLEAIAVKVNDALTELEKEHIIRRVDTVDVAVMGCAVNGPGEARSTDYGVACGNGRGVIFMKGNIVKTVPEDMIVEELICIIRGNL